MKPLKILFVHAAAEFATWDVGMGYARALRRQGHQIVDFITPNRLKYHGLALRNSPQPEIADDIVLVSRLASEGIVVEALRERVELIIVTAGGGIHPDGLELCNRAGFPVAVIFTESPYEDEMQAVYAQHAGHVFTNERVSSRRFGWVHVPCAYDPAVHHPYEFDRHEACDVLIAGSGWPERQRLLEAVDWSGVKLRLIGYWPGVTEESPLHPFYEFGPLDNAELSRLYGSAKLTVNAHRYSPIAESLNPRAYEAGACGIYHISDWRAEMSEVYGDVVPIYRDATDLERLVKHALRHERARRNMAQVQRQAVIDGGHTFDDRAAVLMTAITG